MPDLVHYNARVRPDHVELLKRMAEHASRTHRLTFTPSDMLRRVLDDELKREKDRARKRR